MAKTTTAATKSPATKTAASPKTAARPAGQGTSNGQAGPRPISKSELVAKLCEKTALNRKQIAEVFDALNGVIGAQLGKKGPGVFVIHGLVKFKVVRKPAVKAKQGTNPFTKEAMTFKAKPARNVVKALPLKFLKDLV